MNFKKIAMIATAVAAPISIIGFGLMMGGGFKNANVAGINVGCGPFNCDAGSKTFWDYYNNIGLIPSNMPGKDEIKTAGDLVIAGSVLFSIFGILAIASGIAWFAFRNK